MARPKGEFRPLTLREAHICRRSLTREDRINANHLISRAVLFSAINLMGEGTPLAVWQAGLVLERWAEMNLPEPVTLRDEGQSYQEEWNAGDPITFHTERLASYAFEMLERKMDEVLESA